MQKPKKRAKKQRKQKKPHKQNKFNTKRATGYVSSKQGRGGRGRGQAKELIMMQTQDGLDKKTIARNLKRKHRGEGEEANEAGRVRAGRLEGLARQ